MNRLHVQGALLSLLLLATQPAWAQDSPLLTIDLPDGSRQYDLSQLKTLGEAEFSTSTVWTEGIHRFTGVPLAHVLADAGIESGPNTEGSVTATAVNDYAIDIPLSQVGPEYPLVAYMVDGAEMSVRDKGPLWIVYPYDSSSDYRTEVIYSRSIWQLNRLSMSSAK